jgi:hypothetical protein
MNTPEFNLFSILSKAPHVHCDPGDVLIAHQAKLTPLSESLYIVILAWY